jgi:hypothetical protein
MMKLDPEKITALIHKNQKNMMWLWSQDTKTQLRHAMGLY